MGRTPEEQKQLDELTDVARELRGRVARSSARGPAAGGEEVRGEAQHLANSYEKAIRDLEVLERKERLDAIAQFEEFLQRYPDDPKLHAGRDVPPGRALLRALQRRSHAWRCATTRSSSRRWTPRRTRRRRPSRRSTSAKSIAHLPAADRAVPRLPAQRRAPTTCSATAWRSRTSSTRAAAAYQRADRPLPEAKFATEAWVRIGEYYFDAYNDPDALAKAADAYEHAIEDTTHALYDKALYKLGWTYYRMDRFDDAVSRFLALVDYYQAEAKAQGRGGGRRRPAQRGAPVHRHQLRRREVGLAGQGQESSRSWAAARTRPRSTGAWATSTSTRPSTPRRSRPTGWCCRRTRSPRRAADSAEDRPGLRARPQAGRGLRRGGEAGQHVRPGHAVAREVQARPRRHRRRAGAGREEPLLHRRLPPPAGAGVQAGGQVRAGEGDLRDRGQGLRQLPGALPRVARTPTRCSSIYAECLYNSFQFARGRQALRRGARLQPRTRSTRRTRPSRRCSPGRSRSRADIEEQEAARSSKPLRVERAARGREADSSSRWRTRRSDADRRLGRLRGQARRTTSKAPGIAYKAAELFYAHNDFPEARKRFEAIVKTYPKNEVAQVRHQPHRRELPDRQGLGERRGGLRAAGRRTRTSSTPRATSTRTWSSSSWPAASSWPTS